MTSRTACPDRRPALLMIASGVKGTAAENHLGQATTLDELRDYQQELLERAESALQSPKARVMLQLPTGGGKTHIAGALLARMLGGGRKAVWLTHRAELAEQTRGMLADAGVSAINNLNWVVGDQAPHLANGVVILMAQTVGRRTSKRQIWDSYGSNDLLVIDEAHHASAAGWERAIDQWPGRVLGLTATPWRLSKTEGFNHLFRELHCGPQVHELQSDGWLCTAQMLMPPAEDIIRGGNITVTGDFNESGILGANRDHPDVMTAGALRFWQAHAAGRQTVIYAISKDHAHNLTAVFNAAEIPTTIMLDDTPRQERDRAIEAFRNRTVRVLVNVAIATEGFDLPDASCVVLTRPTMSLGLYLQMVGRGLRPKANGGDCLILDLAGNAEIHGLPDENRQWSLYPRGNNPPGDAPVVRCEKCDGVSPAASRFCNYCHAPFGKDCLRCGKWRAFVRWSYETHCGDLHDLVCDYCHYDAHIQSHLPVIIDELRKLAELEDPHGDEGMVTELDDLADEEMAIELDLDGSSFLRSLLEEERRRIDGGAEERKEELRSFISARELELADDDKINEIYENYVVSLPLWERPRPGRQTHLLYGEWEGDMKQELTAKRDELAKLEAQPVDKQVIINNARTRLLQLFEGAARDAGLLPRERIREVPERRKLAENLRPASTDTGEWMTLVQLGEWGKEEFSRVRPLHFQGPQGKETSVTSWTHLLFQTAEWLIREGLLTENTGAVTVGNMTKRYLIHTTPEHPNGQASKQFKPLSNGLWVDCQWDPRQIIRRCAELVAKFDRDPEQFRVLLP